MTNALPGVLLMLLCLLQSAYGLANLGPEVRDPANFLPPRILVGVETTTVVGSHRPQTLDRQAIASALPEWLSRDPLGESESINLYAYCGNDPINYVDVDGLWRINTQEAASDQRVEWLLMQLSAGSGLPTAPLNEWKLYIPESGDFGLYKPYGPEDYKRAQTFVQNLGRPSMRPMTDEQAAAARQPSFGPAPEWIPSATAALTLGAANTPLNAQINSDWLLPTGAGVAGAKFLFGGMKPMLPMLATGARMESRLFTYQSPANTPFRGNIFYTGNWQGRLWATTHSPGPWAFDRGLKNSFLRAWRSGRWKPFASSQEITGNAAAQFSQVRAIGPFRGWKRAGGQYHTRTPGDLNLSDGTFLPATTKQTFLRYWDSTFSHGFDAGVMTSPLWVPLTVEAAVDSWYGEDG